MDRLEIIQEMLTSAGEYATDTELDNHPDVSKCRRVIDSVLSDMLGEGYMFNSRTMTLQPDSTNKIPLGDSVMSVDLTDNSKIFVKRDGYVYNITDDTFTFTSGQECNIVYKMSVEDLPPAAATYVKWNCVCRFLANEDIGGTMYKKAEEERQIAWTQFQRYIFRHAGKKMNQTPYHERVHRGRDRHSTRGKAIST